MGSAVDFVSRWWREDVVGAGHLPLFVFLCTFIATFVFIRFSVRMIRAQVSWWPGNVTPGGHHIHHVVFGIVFMVVGGIGAIAVRDPTSAVKSVLAGVFAVGAALVLDEFALVLHLRDVYWTEAGRTSVDAVFVAVAAVGLILLGVRPSAFVDWSDYRDDPGLRNALLLALYGGIQLVLVTFTLLKGKVWTALLGLFFEVFLIVGAIRLSRPDAPWARWRYADRPKRLRRAERREERLRRPLIRAKIRFQEFLSGRHDLPDAEAGADAGADAETDAAAVRPAAAPEQGPAVGSGPDAGGSPRDTRPDPPSAPGTAPGHDPPGGDAPGGDVPDRRIR